MQLSEKFKAWPATAHGCLKRSYTNPQVREQSVLLAAQGEKRSTSSEVLPSEPFSPSRLQAATRGALSGAEGLYVSWVGTLNKSTRLGCRRPALRSVSAVDTGKKAKGECLRRRGASTGFYWKAGETYRHTRGETTGQKGENGFCSCTFVSGEGGGNCSPVYRGDKTRSRITLKGEKENLNTLGGCPHYMLILSTQFSQPPDNPIWLAIN